MIRSLSLAIFTLALGIVPGLAQPGANRPNPAPARNVIRQGMGMMGGMGGGMAGMGGMGGMMGGMGGGMGGVQSSYPRRTVQVQIQGGKKLPARCNSASDYHERFWPVHDQARICKDHPVRFQGQGEGEEDAEENVQAEHEAVITTSGEEIRGDVQSTSWVLEIECGTLTLNPETLRSMTFLPPTETKGHHAGTVFSERPRLHST